MYTAIWNYHIYIYTSAFFLIVLFYIYITSNLSFAFSLRFAYFTFGWQNVQNKCIKFLQTFSIADINFLSSPNDKITSQRHISNTLKYLWFRVCRTTGVVDFQALNFSTRWDLAHRLVRNGNMGWENRLGKILLLVICSVCWRAFARRQHNAGITRIMNKSRRRTVIRGNMLKMVGCVASIAIGSTSIASRFIIFFFFFFFGRLFSIWFSSSSSYSFPSSPRQNLHLLQTHLPFHSQRLLHKFVRSSMVSRIKWD